MEDTAIIDLYWQRSDQAISETDRKYGRYCHRIAISIFIENDNICISRRCLRFSNCFIKSNYPSILLRDLIQRNDALHVEAVQLFELAALPYYASQVRLSHRRQPVQDAVSGHDGHYEKVDRPEAGLERHLRPDGRFLWRQNPRIAEIGPHVKGKCTAATGRRP